VPVPLTCASAQPMLVSGRGAGACAGRLAVPVPVPVPITVIRGPVLVFDCALCQCIIVSDASDVASAPASACA
jgi:hypothetical protein